MAPAQVLADGRVWVFFEEDQVRNNIKNLHFLSATDNCSSVFEEIVSNTKDHFGVQLH